MNDARHPALGFGTGSILGRHDRATSERAIATALSAGIRHFDTARSYGWGEAERVLGQAIRAVPRDELYLVGKCGILPVRRTRALGALKAFARKLMAVMPGLAGPLRRAASTAALQPSYSYDVGVLRDSLATSLRELDTPYLDVLLLHNFDCGKEGIDAVVAWFGEERARGTIRRYGFSINDRLVESLDWLDAKGLLDGAVIQVALSPELLEMPPRHARRDFIVHSVFRRDDPAMAGMPSDLATIATTLTSRINCRAIVCAMFSDHHIRGNAVTIERIAAG